MMCGWVGRMGLERGKLCRRLRAAGRGIDATNMNDMSVAKAKAEAKIKGRKSVCFEIKALLPVSDISATESYNSFVLSNLCKERLR